jgi:gluconate 2-dehydrogenase gamma chain
VENETHRAPDAYMFFTEREASTVSAMAERIIPADSTGPGATDADVIVYIDRALAGYGRNLQRLYRRGVIAINRLAGENSAGKTFFELPIAKQDELLTRLADWLFSTTRADIGVRPEGWTLLAEFFGAVRLHTIEGMFCDPMYGGNRDCLGWKLIGFPGAQWGYSAEQMKLGFDAATIPPKTLADLRRERLAGEAGQLRA